MTHRTRERLLRLALVATFGLQAGCAARQSATIPQAGPALPPSTLVEEGPRTTAPFAFLKFCDAHPQECAPGTGADVRPMDPAVFAELEEVNLAVNRTIKARDDRPADDTWELEPEAGDCEDYAITKRSRLIARGWPSSALTLAIVTAPTGPHMVLLASTSSGEYALDSLTDDIRPWSETGYTFVSRQSAKAPREWVSVKRLS